MASTEEVGVLALPYPLPPLYHAMVLCLFGSEFPLMIGFN